MKNATTIFFTAACLARAAMAVTMASQPWTTNRIAEAEARLSAKVAAATNGLAAKADLGGYLPLTGGTVTGELTVNGVVNIINGDDTAGVLLFHDIYGNAMITERYLGIGFSYYKTDYPIYLKESILEPDGSKVMTETLTNEKLGGYATKADVDSKADASSVYTKTEVDEKIGNAVVKDAENVVTGSFSIKRTFGNYEQSLSFGESDPDGPSIVLNRLYSTAPYSFFSGSIALIPSSGEKTSLLSRIKESSAASWDARQEVESIVSSAMLPTDPTFSNAVLAVGLNIDTNSVAVLNEIASTFGGFPIEGTATTVGGLLAALAAAVAWLERNKANKATTLAGYGITDAATKEELAALTAKVEYPLYAVPSTGVLKDRAINTTSLATVTVPDNFTDLLIRASVTSSLSVTMPDAISTKYGDTFPGEGGEYLITITKTGAAEAYVRTIKLEVANA